MLSHAPSSMTGTRHGLQAFYKTQQYRKVKPNKPNGPPKVYILIEEGGLAWEFYYILKRLPRRAKAVAIFWFCFW